MKIDARPRNWLIPVALAVLREGSSHGYALMGRLEELGLFGYANPGASGTLYRTLRRLEDEGLCESEWGASSGGGPARRTYSVTDAGEQHLAAWAEGCGRYRDTLDSFQRAYAGEPRRRRGDGPDPSAGP